jgi:glycosyltransferase involved in cell wall biosynthesis
LFAAYRRRGFDSFLAVGNKELNHAGIIEVPNDLFRNPWARFWRTKQLSFARNKASSRARLAGWLANLGELERWQEWRSGVEDFHFPATARLLEILPRRPAIVHVHNLHGGYFDLRVLMEFSRRVPLVMTLHDEWLFTGHCACTFGCTRWEKECGACPDLKTYPAVRRDSTTYNLRRKHEIYSRSRLYVAAPSRWLLDKATRSILQAGIQQARVIPYGIDQTIFKPGDQRVARQELNLSQTAKIALFVANKARTNPYKDYATMEAAIQRMAARDPARELLFLCVGEEREEERIGRAAIRYYGYQTAPEKVARFYQAADVYLHAAHTDNFPNAVLEALACGTPVVATAVGGIQEQIEDGRNGFLIPAKDSEGMADRTLCLLNDDALRVRFSETAVEIAKQRFNLDRQAEEYLAWYRDLSKSFIGS